MRVSPPEPYRGRLIAVTFALIAALGLPLDAHAQHGAARGKVAVVDAQNRAYGYSAYNQTWTVIELDTPANARLASDYLAYVRTQGRLFSFNATNDHWYSTSFAGQPLGESAEGATTIVWTSQNAYAIASLWAIWRSMPWPAGEQPLGGGSCGNFAMVWTQHHAYAFHSASGQWMQQMLDEPASGGITCNGFGLVWTQGSVFFFDPTPGGWSPVNLDALDGISVTGSGSVALAWAPNAAEAYSNVLDSWTSLDEGAVMQGGTAQGELALLWSTCEAWVFDANTGLWDGVTLQAPGAAPPVPPGSLGGGLRIAPNPSSSGSVQLTLPSGRWTIEIFDVAGRRVRSLAAEADSAPVTLSWDGADASGRQAPAGSYWVQARSTSGVEGRRVVLAP